MISFKLFCEKLEQKLGHVGFTGKVFVYFNINLSRKLNTPLFSIKDMSTGRVIGHETSLSMKNVVFKVADKGNERVRDEKIKNVHAGIVGYIDNRIPEPLSKKVTYNPYKYKTFVKIPEETPVSQAGLLSIVNGKVFADNLE